MTRALRSLFGLLGAFFRWWLGELAALIPSAFRRGMGSRGNRLIVESGPEGLLLYRLRGREAVRLGPGNHAAGRTKASVTLALPREEVVTRPTQLPLAAEENLAEVIGFEMDRLTPFSRDEVYYACRVTGRDAKAGCLRVDILLAPRRRVDALLGKLESQGISVSVVDVASGEPGRSLGINLLPKAEQAKSSRLVRAAAVCLTATAIVMLVVALEVPLQRKAEYAAALDAKVAEERARVAVLQRLREEIASLDRPQSSLTDLKRESTLALALLDQVTRLLPDDTWLSQLSFNGDRLDLAGFSPSSSKLITTFEQSPQFAGAVFRAPVTQDPRLGLERFSLSMRVTRKVGQ